MVWTHVKHHIIDDGSYKQTVSMTDTLSMTDCTPNR